MSMLNLVLQNLTLAGPKVIEYFERTIKRNCLLTGVRNIGKREPEFKAAMTDSIKEVIETLNSKTARIKWKENQVSMHE